MLGAADIFTFPPLNLNWVFKGEGGGGVRQWTLVRGILDKSKLMHFHRFYVMCGQAFLSLFKRKAGPTKRSEC